jgi:predicted AlkP superfamily pyrophosphatase or phosphodiesterase
MRINLSESCFARVRFAICIIFVLVLANSVLSQGPKKTHPVPLILISIDGFRYDYFEKHSPEKLNSLVKEGTRARWMTPAYPTKTFPNHYTIATGLYPDNHGMIENNMYDAEFNAVFGLSRREEVMNPRWWGGEPIWNTAMKAGFNSAAFFWPGTEAAIGGMQPKFWRPYEHDTPHEIRVDTVLGWLDLPESERPVVITLYFSDVDDAGHSFGPDARQTRDAVQKVDAAIKRLVDGIEARGMRGKLNMIIVSDHGMAAYRVGDSIVLDDMFDVEDAERIFWVGEFTQIFPKPGREKKIYDSIKAKLPKNAYIYRNGRFPARFKFGKNKRVAPIVVVPGEGTTITNRARYEGYERNGTLDNIRGAHGYDNELVSMRAIFLGHGPAFKVGYTARPFESVDVYELMCHILGIKPAKNDGKFKRIRGVFR